MGKSTPLLLLPVILLLLLQVIDVKCQVVVITEKCPNAQIFINGVCQKPKASFLDYDLCDFCPSGYECKDGKCVEHDPFIALPCVAPCLPGQKCINGVCVGGVDIRFDFEVPCAGPCSPGHRCFFGKCAPPPKIRRTKRECIIQQDCPDSQTCSANGKCIRRDPFSFIMKKCSTDIDCGASMLCSNGKCIVNNGLGGLCSADSQCPSGFICIDGKCKKSSHRRIGNVCIDACMPGQRCVNGVCVDRLVIGQSEKIESFPSCTRTRCPPGYECIDGECIGHDPFAALPCVAPCLPGQKCINGVCVGGLFIGRSEKIESFELPCVAPCAPGQKCVNGVCVGGVDTRFDFEIPCTRPCSPGHHCFNGRCLSPPKHRRCERECPRGTRCLRGRCVVRYDAKSGK